MQWIDNLIFVLLLALAVGFFAKNVKKLNRNIRLGKGEFPNDQSSKRWATMWRVAFGQSKMGVRPIPALLHLIVYVGFIIINIEVLEILLDGIFGTHRIFGFLGGIYDLLIASFEVLALLVIVAVVVFWIRRNIIKIRRFWKPEMKGFPKKDADYILYFELVLMLAFLTMNASDWLYHQKLGQELAGAFPISSNLIAPLLTSFSSGELHMLERAAWWLHIIGIFVFLNYLYYSKHLHILLAFPNTYYSKIQPAGQFKNNETVTKEVKLMMDPNADSFAAPSEASEPETFGAKDVFDLTKVQLLNAYTCTECGRCTAECPANLTGKKLSPRKIMMDTRDRVEEVGKIMDKAGEWKEDGKTLINNYITPEELWACTTCNACTQACPVNIDPMSIIVDLRQYLVMEQSAAPQELNMMMTNIENNQAPWPFNRADGMKWAEGET